MQKVFRAPKVVTIDVKFQCEKCSTYVIRAVRVGPQVWILSSDLPDGWKVKIDHEVFFSYCPKHAKDV